MVDVSQISTTAKTHWWSGTNEIQLARAARAFECDLVLERTGEEWRIYSDWPVEEHSHTELMTRLALLDEPATVAELVRLATGG